MSYCNDVREKYDDDDKKNPYYEGYLNNADRNFLFGYDWSVDNEMDKFFKKIFIFSGEIEKNVFNVEKIDKKILAMDKIDEKTLKKANKETRIALFFKDNLSIFMEMERNEIVTQIIDNMDKRDYKKNYDEVWKKEDSKKKEEHSYA